MPWRRKWQPTPVFLPESRGQRSLAGCSPWARKEPATPEGRTLPLSLRGHEQAELALLCFTLVQNLCCSHAGVSGDPEPSKSVGACFPMACAHAVSLCGIWGIFPAFQTFSLLLDPLWWPVTSGISAVII